MSSAELARAEKAAGRKIYVGGAAFMLPIALAMFIGAQFLRYFGSLTGIDVFTVSEGAKEYMLSAPIYISSWLGLTALVILGPVTLITRSAVVSWIGWATSTAAFFTSLLCGGCPSPLPVICRGEWDSGSLSRRRPTFWRSWDSC